MAWGKIDDNLHAHPKFLEAGPVASWVYITSISWSNRYGTDGFVPARQAARLAEGADEVIATLIAVRLWDEADGGFLIHDFFEDDRNKPAKWWKELKATRSAAGRRGGQAIAKAIALPIAQTIAKAKPEAKPKPVPVPVPVVNPPISPQNGNGHGKRSQDVEAVWAAWIESTGSNAKLTDDRRRKIEARLRDGYPVADLIDAVQGWKADPWEERRLHRDVTVLLRDGAHLEKFRDLHRGGQPVSKLSAWAP